MIEAAAFQCWRRARWEARGGEGGGGGGGRGKREKDRSE